MTSPDRKVPTGAYSGTGGAQRFAGMGKLTLESAKSAVQVDLVRPYTQVNVNLGSVVDSGVKQFAADLCDAVTGATGGLINLSGWARQLRSDADQALRNSVNAQQTADGAKQTADNQTAIIQATNSRVQVVVNGLPVKPYWETMNLTEEASFPRNMLHRAAWSVSASGSSIDVGYTPVYTPPVNTLEGAFIRCLYSGGRKVVSYIPDAVSGPCELYVVVGRMVPSGDIKIEWVSPNQTPDITGVRVERTVELPSELVFEQGETAFVGIHQRGAGRARPLLGIEAVEIPRPPSVWPPQLNAQFPAAALLSAGTTLAANSLAFGSRKVPYLSLGKAAAGDPVKLMFFEDFESGVMPDSLVRMSNRAAKVSNGVFVVDDLNDGLRRYLSAQKLSYDDQMVTGRIRKPTGRGARLYLRSDAGNNSYLGLTVTDTSVLLSRWTDRETGTLLASADVGIADNDQVRIKAVGNVFTAEKLVDGAWTTILVHRDPDNTIPKGAAFRYPGLGTERASWVNGGGWGEWKAEDL
ncbi:hypothetical protein [Nocardia sp. NPDC050175]|uniref:hypothetical protein n=1 Tax=Nocardia sp. NPDC050175 TaxID=3364317 RepID=UPI0037A7CFD4